MTDQETTRRMVVPLIVLALLVGALFPVAIFQPPQAAQPGEEAGTAAEQAGPPHRVALQVEPATVTLGMVKELAVRAPGIEAVEGLVLSAPDIGRFKQAVSAADLRAGVPVRLTGEKLGTYRLQAQANGMELGSAWVTVALPRVADADDLEYELRAGEMVPRAGGGLTVPTFVVAKHKDKRETKVRAGATVTILDLKTKNPLGSGKLLKESAQSQAVALAIEQDTPYTLIGSVKYDETGPEYLTDPLTIKYETGDLQFGLDARPASETVYATAGTPAVFTVYLTQKGTRFYPRKPVTVVATPDRSGVRIDPRQLVIEPASGLAACKFVSTRGQDVKIGFGFDSTTAPAANVQVTFEFVSWFYVIACVGAVAGRFFWLLATLLVNREQALLDVGLLNGQQIGARAVMELLLSLIGGYVLTFAYLHGWFYLFGLFPQNIDWPVALVIGMIGGVVGVGISKLVSPSLSLPG